MRLQSYLNEAWITVFGNKKFEVLEIPPDQIRDINDIEITSYMGIRFTVINKTKKLYVWDAYLANHNAVWDKLINKSKPYSCTPNTNVLQGMAKKKSGKWEMSQWDDYQWMSHEDSTSPDLVSIEDMIKAFKWVDRYINVTKLLKRI
jgi:hypothetical protein